MSSEQSRLGLGGDDVVSHCCQVTIEKNRIATSTKSEELKVRMVKEAGDAIKACLQLLASNGNISTAEINELSADRLLKHTTEELSSSPVLCMELRTFIAHHFLVERPAEDATQSENSEATSEDLLLKCVDLDPFLGGQADMRKVNSVKPVAAVLAARDRWWLDVKTVWGPERWCDVSICVGVRTRN